MKDRYDDEMRREEGNNAKGTKSNNADTMRPHSVAKLTVCNGVEIQIAELAA